MMKTLGLGSACAAIALISSGCGGSSDDTGIAEVDLVIEAVEAADVATLASLITYFEVPCGPQQGIPSPPMCPDGAPDGTPVEVWWSAECEGFYVTREETSAHIQGRMQSVDLKLYAAYRGGTRLGLDADYVVLFYDPDSPGPGGQEVALRDGRIQSWTMTCGPITVAWSSLDAAGVDAIIPPRED
jgi:hypothetical protein